MSGNASRSARVQIAVAAVLWLVLGPGSAVAAAEGTAPPAAEKPATEKSDAAAASGPTVTLDFVRDAVQVTTNPTEISSLAFSADGQILASGGGGGRNGPGSGQVRVWDFAKRQEVASYPSNRGDLSVSVSPDGKRVAWSNWSGDIWMRQIGGPELLHDSFQFPARVVFSPDNTLLVAAAEGHRLLVWDALQGKQRDGFHGNTFSFYWIGFSPDGKYLIGTGGGGNDRTGIQAAVWEVASREQIYRITDSPQRIVSAAVSPDNKILATCAGKSIVLRDLATGTKIKEIAAADRPIQRILFSPDGKLLASTGGDSNDGKVTLWDVEKGEVAGTLAGHLRDVRAMAFTPDGKTLATGGGDRSIRLWDVAARQQTAMLQEAKNLPNPKAEAAAILAVAYSPDGNSVATASEDGQVSVYNLGPAGPVPVRSWPAHADAAAALAYSTDGLTLVSGGYDKAIKFWNPATGEQIRALSGHAGWVVSLAFSHDGRTLASGSYDRTIRLWNVSDGIALRALTGHTATVRAVAFSHNDKLCASAGADHTVRLWDVADGKELATLRGHEAGVRGVAFSPDDRQLASGGEDQTIKLWNVETYALNGTLTGHTDMVSSVAFAQDTLVSTSWDRTIRTWDAVAREMRGNLGAGASVVALAVSSDGTRLVTAGANQSLALWKATVVEGRPAAVLGDFRAFPWNAAFSADGASVAVAAGGNSDETDLYLYDTATKAEKYHVTFPGSARSVAFAPDGQMLALGYPSKQLLLVDAASGREVASLEEQRIEGNPAQVNAMRSAEVTFSPDGKLLAAATLDHAVRIYDVEQRALAKTLIGHNDAVLALAFSPNQEELISGSRDRTAVIWELPNSGRRYSLPLQPGPVGSVAWSPDGKSLAIACSTGVCTVWHAATGTPLRTIAAHPGQVNEIRFSPDGKLLATAGSDRKVKLWDIGTGERLQTFACHTGAVECLRFSPDGKSFLTTGRGTGGAKLWQVPNGEGK
ncbi:MAG TPA: hypothetical protein VMF30_17855 [Pirellulales bacterium]|nr:hypothetical protein [Pirellulales bacterium]